MVVSELNARKMTMHVIDMVLDLIKFVISSSTGTNKLLIIESEDKGGSRYSEGNSPNNCLAKILDGNRFG